MDSKDRILMEISGVESAMGLTGNTKDRIREAEEFLESITPRHKIVYIAPDGTVTADRELAFNQTRQGTGTYWRQKF